MQKYLHLSLASLLSLGCAITYSSEAINDTGKIAVVYITNSSNEPIRMIPYNKLNKTHYAHFNCFYPIPKEYQNGIPSPHFDTVIDEERTLESALIKKGQTVAYFFNSECDNKEDPLLNETFGFVSKGNVSKSLLVFGNMYENTDTRALEYTKRVSPSKAIYGNIVAPAFGFIPFQVTILPHPDLKS
jgi:hypothetical protein